MGERVALFSTHCLEDLGHWVRTDRKVALRLLRILRETVRDPFAGVGKPEPGSPTQARTVARGLSESDSRYDEVMARSATDSGTHLRPGTR